MSKIKRTEDQLDQTVEDSFPASDPPSHTPSTSTRKGAAETDADKSGEADREDATPKGSPTSDRHAAETTAGKIEGREPPQAKHK
jgi:hypothetical protein